MDPYLKAFRVQWIISPIHCSTPKVWVGSRTTAQISARGVELVIVHTFYYALLLTRQGIPYEVQYSSCGVCAVFLCINCVPHHMPAHQPSMIRLTSRQTISSAYRDPRSCGLCHKAVHVRYDCRQCQQSICCDCWDSAEVTRHAHTDYMAIEPPGKIATLQFAGIECRDCVFRTTLGHCDLCLLGKTFEILERLILITCSYRK